MTTTYAKVPDPPRAEFILNLQAQEADFRLARKNERFAKASPARKRVIIAKDVLEWLKIGKLLPAPGTYLSPFLYDAQNEEWQHDDEGNLVDGKVKETKVNGGKCSACALGAVFACAVERMGGMRGFWGNSSVVMVERLSPFFDADQLRLIEVAFECFSDSPNDPNGRAYEFGTRIGRGDQLARARMEAIMLNIIANKGTFVP